MRDKITISIDKELIAQIEEERTRKLEYIRQAEDKSHFIEKLIIIGLNKYRQRQRFFDQIDLNNIDLSKINF